MTPARTSPRLASLAAGLASVLTASCATAPSGETSTDAVDPRLAAGVASVTGDELAAHVEVLASDAFEGRFPGTAGEARTVAYLSAAYARAGLEPLVGGSFLQPVPLRETRVAVRRELALSGDDERELTFPEDVLWYPPPEGHATGGGASGGLRDAPVFFAGHGVVAPEHGWDDYAGLDVRGALVVALWGDPPAPEDDPTRFEGAGLSPHGTRAAKAAAASARGAAALLLVHAQERVGVGFELLADHAVKPSYTLADGSEGTPATSSGEDDPGLLQGTLPGPGLDALLVAAGHDAAAVRAAADAGDTAGFALPWTATVELATSRRDVVSHNVVGWLPGSERPDEVVVYTAHWDHVGLRATPDAAGDRICNGAVDNATGTAALLEIAQAFGGLATPPERSVLFLATTSEEQGLLGAEHYAAHPLVPLEDTVGVLNMDALFPFGETKGMTVVAMGSSELEQPLAVAAAAVGRRLYPDPSPELGAFYRSDHYPFAKRGVPALFAVGGPAHDPDVGETVSFERFVDYVTHRYHQPADEYDPATWDMAGIVQDVRTFFHTGWLLARDERFPNWVEGSEYRPLRDAMRAGRGGAPWGAGGAEKSGAVTFE